MWRYPGYFLNPRKWHYALRHPNLALGYIKGFLFAPAEFRRIAANVDGLISVNLGVRLYNTVLSTKSTPGNIIEIGAFKGLSTCYLSLAAAKIGKRVKSFELFEGLPTANAVLDTDFHVGMHASTQLEYERNVKLWGRREVVDLVIGDAKETLAPALNNEGFSIAFVDVDVYDVARQLLLQLWHKVRFQGEEIIIHDINSPGIRKAVDELLAIAKQLCVETIIDNGTTAVLTVSREI